MKQFLASYYSRIKKIYFLARKFFEVIAPNTITPINIKKRRIDHETLI